MSESPLRDKSKDFAKQIVVLCRDIKSAHRETVLTNQLLRSGTSIGANIHEAQYAQGTKDFISKLEIAQKECREAVVGEEWRYRNYRMKPGEKAKNKHFCPHSSSVSLRSTASPRGKPNGFAAEYKSSICN